jgi:NitT/TauT family transport system ATP-binding protein
VVFVTSNMILKLYDVFYMSPNAILISDVAYRFSTQDSSSPAILENASLSIPSGEFVSIVGPTGCGKSTLLNMVSGLLFPSSGVVSVFGQKVNSVQTCCGYMFQGETLLPWRTTAENIGFGLELRGVPQREIDHHVRDWLARVHLDKHADKFPHELSGGMRKRASLAQMFITNPDILLMDEPFSALDVQTRNLMENQLLDIWTSDKKTVLFVTHDLEEAIALSDRVILMQAGPRSKPVKEFVIDINRPRDVFEIRLTNDFVSIHREIWDALRVEVERSHRETVA